MKYCVYIAWYRSTTTKRIDDMPPFYIGSGITRDILDRKYFGSPTSKKYKRRWKNIVKNDPDLIELIIIEQYDDRKEALFWEGKLQELYDVVSCPVFVNQSRVTSNGFTTAGYTYTEESKQKMSEAQSGEKNPMFGKTRTDETKQKMSEALTGENNPLFGKKHKRVTCEHCGKDVAVNNYARFHGDKCKYN